MPDILIKFLNQRYYMYKTYIFSIICLLNSVLFPSCLYAAEIIKPTETIKNGESAPLIAYILPALISLIISVGTGLFGFWKTHKKNKNDQFNDFMEESAEFRKELRDDRKELKEELRLLRLELTEKNKEIDFLKVSIENFHNHNITGNDKIV